MELSTSNWCLLFHVDLPFITDEISTTLSNTKHLQSPFENPSVALDSNDLLPETASSNYKENILRHTATFFDKTDNWR